MNNTAFITVDLCYGDSGKGTIVDALTRKYNSDLNIRYSGGPQCAHWIVTDEGIEHCFSQFGSGTFAGARTFLAKNVLINPLTLEDEASYLIKKGIKNPYENLFIDENCIIITPFHRAFNKLVELSRGKNKHGSCGHGVWSSIELKNNLGEDFTVRVKDIIELYSGGLEKIELIQKYFNYKINKNNLLNYSINDLFSLVAVEYKDNVSNLNNEDLSQIIWWKYIDILGKVNVIKDNGKSLINSSRNPVFEGNQGILLDDQHGFHPYSTPTKTTSVHAKNLLKEIDFKGEVKTIGITRTFMTRHGAGPFPTENKKGYRSDITPLIIDDNNKSNQWQDHFRYGWLDLVLLKYAIKCNGGIDYLAVTHCDKLDLRKEWKVCIDYKYKAKLAREIMNLVLNNGYFSKHKDTMIFDVIPIYNTLSKSQFLTYIFNYLNVPIFITSSGKKPCDKQFLIDI